jgi:hypothetical protein
MTGEVDWDKTEKNGLVNQLDGMFNLSVFSVYLQTL